MAARLGNVLYWLGCILAALTLIWAAPIALQYQMVESVPYRMGAWAGVFLVAAVPWLIGWALRYVLSGQRLKSVHPANEITRDFRILGILVFLFVFLFFVVLAIATQDALIGAGVVLAAILWGIGWALRYILSGPSLKSEVPAYERQFDKSNAEPRNEITRDFSEPYDGNESGKGSVAARLGDVLFWLSNVVAVLVFGGFVVVGVIVVFVFGSPPASLTEVIGMARAMAIFLLLGAALAAVSCTIGWTLRHILQGPTPDLRGYPPLNGPRYFTMIQTQRFS